MKFTDKQLAQIDAVENAAHDLAQVLCPDIELEWNIWHIGEIADMAYAIMQRHGLKPDYPLAELEGADEQ